ncbi:MAG: aldehyde dehydrogenase family protein, partial [Gillisia sp.]
MIISKNPYTGEEIAQIEEFTKEEIDQALSSAEKAFKSWSKTDMVYRSKLMMNAASELKENSKEYAQTITREMGKPIKQA